MLQSEVAPKMSSLSMRRLLMRRSTKLFQDIIVGEVFSLLFIGRILRLRNVYRSKTNIR